MPTLISRDREAKIYVVSEEDTEGETWIDTAHHHKELAERRAAELRNGAAAKGQNGNVFVTEMSWDWRHDRFKVAVDE